MEENQVKMRALISVSDKRGIDNFAKKLSKLGIQIISTGGTSKVLREKGIFVREVSDVTGFPEILDGRIKTLHPRIHAGILAVRGKHDSDLEKNNIKQIDIVIVNLYPFKDAVKSSPDDLDNALENIDIGGVALIRATAKNFRDVVVVVDPEDYDIVCEELKKNKEVSLETKQMLAVKAFRHTAEYDSWIEGFLSFRLFSSRVLRMRYSNGIKLRYGENKHQSGFFYKASSDEPCISNYVQLHGKELSFNNLSDGDTALEIIKELLNFSSAVVIKHATPCGIATGKNLRVAVEEAWNGDRVSAFGGVVAFSREVDLKTAEFLSDKFVEVVIAPSYDRKALEFLREKSKNLRILEIKNLLRYSKDNFVSSSFKHINGGILVQSKDNVLFETWNCVTKNGFPESKKKLAEFALIAVKHAKSNAVVLCVEHDSGFKVLGLGSGQPNRVDSFRKLALTKAEENIKNWFDEDVLVAKKTFDINFEEFKKQKLESCVLASDAFFPFDDTVRAAAEYGINYIVQPGGSIRDKEVIAACDELGLSMVFTGTRHFRH